MELRFDAGESIQVDSQYRVNLTQIFSNYSETWVEFSSASDSTF